MRIKSTRSYRNEDGQILLMALLIIAVGASVALSMIGRTTIDIGMSKQIEESQAAFNVAEAGIEKALTTGVGETGSLDPQSGVTYTTTISTIGSDTEVYLIEDVEKGMTANLWLADHADTYTLNESETNDINDTIQVCWQQSGSAIEVMIYSKLPGSDGQYHVTRAGYRPYTLSKNDNFTVISTSGGCERDWVYQNINLNVLPSGDIPLALRIRPYYQNTSIAFSGQLQIQSRRIESIGTTASGVSRKISVDQEFPSPFALFDNVVTSKGNFN